MKKLIRNFLLFFAVFLIIAAIFSSFSGKKAIPAVGVETLISQINSAQVNSITVNGNSLNVVLKNNNTELVQKESGESLSSLLSNYKVDPAKTADINISVAQASGWDYWLNNIIPFVLPFLLVGVFLYFMMRGLQNANSRAMSFGDRKSVV